MRKWLLLIILFVAVFYTGEAFGQGCSQCRIMSEQSAEIDEAEFTNNINYGILYLMLIPYLLLMFLFRERIWSFLKSRVFQKRN